MLVCKYIFDNSIYDNLIPVFNDGYEGYTITDEIDSENNNHVIRTIECDTLPTYMKFGSMTENGVYNGANSLLELLYLDTSGLTYSNAMFRCCKNLIKVNCVVYVRL